MDVSMGKSNQKEPLDSASVCGHEDPAAVRELLTKVGDKWSIFLILSLAQLPGGRARFSELERAIPGISQRMLTLTLRNLERDGLLTRELFPEVPLRVEYELTTLSRSLMLPMQGLVDWVTKNWQQVKVARTEFDAKRTEALR
jgi:DNA-binding HxlR family transcriptional regulator